ncbi:MAG: hypothetical protein QM477_02090 [Planctomycetota bacterium]
MARKRHLLEVLRERENRLAEGDDAQSAHPPAPPLRSVGLPPMLIPLVGAGIALILLIWGGFAFFGKDDAAKEQTAVIEAVEPEMEQAVLAVTYDGSRRDFAIEVARSLLALGYDAKLAPSQSPSGEGQLQLFVRATEASELESLLQEIRGLSLEGQPAPFVGASLDTLPH